MNELQYSGKVLEYIRENWSKCIRTTEEDTDFHLALPFQYTVPCIKNMFNGLFYWDTYFTNQGLIRIGQIELAKSNVDNLLSEVERFGYVPNANWRPLLTRSQPPYLSMMVRDIFEATGDREWLKRAVATLHREYDFWMRRRMTPTGLSRYFHNASREEQLEFYEEANSRLKFNADSEEKKVFLGIHYLAEAESGWDYNPRFDGRCSDFLPIDLNSQLYVYETNFAHFCRLLGQDGEASWLEKAAARKELINKYCWDSGRGQFMDYDYINGVFSKVRSLASFHPLWAGLATQEQAESTMRNLHFVESEYGAAVCERHEAPYLYQWDFPNCWPPLQFITIQGLNRYGFKKEARRIAEKYAGTVIRNFLSTGDLWEKYNSVDGTTNVADEYEMPSMMGWTAAVFVYATEYLNS